MPVCSKTIRGRCAAALVQRRQTRRAAAVQSLSARRRGSILTVVMLCAFVLVMLITAGFYFGILFTAEQKVRNGVDASALALARSATDRRFKASPPWDDCADTKGRIGLMNINRVYGKALLIALNAEAMQKEGQGGAGPSNAQEAAKEAAETADFLKKAMQDTKKSEQEVASIVRAAPEALKQDEAPPTVPGGRRNGGGPSFDESCVHRGAESNLELNDAQLPDGIKLPANAKVKEGATYLAGYTPIEANGQQFFFVPFRTKELPHLIPLEEFQANKPQVKGMGWASPVPNAFQVSSNAGIAPNMTSVACAVANPQVRYKLAIPHAFVTIDIHPTEVTWMVNDNEKGKSQYGFQAEKQHILKRTPIECQSKLDGKADLGNEYSQYTLMSVIKAVPGDHEKALKRLAQRLAEIDPDFNGATLERLLSTTNLVANEYVYYIYPVYETDDNTDPKISVNTKAAVKSQWLDRNALPDGEERQIGKEELIDEPNKAEGKVVEGPWILTGKQVKVEGKLMWRPGTGYGQNLGTLRIERKATVSFTGKCPGK